MTEQDQNDRIGQRKIEKDRKGQNMTEQDKK